MIKLTELQQNILKVLLKNDILQSSGVCKALVEEGKSISLISVKRNLTELVKLGVLDVQGSGRSTSYKASTLGRIVFDVDASKYVEIEPDKRFGLGSYNFDLFSDIPDEFFSDTEILKLESATDKHKESLKNITPTIHEKELQRLIIELSWKSSKIEGNTYTLLDTEKLILENKEAPGHNKEEAKMILNHKDAFNFIRENSKEYKELTLANIEKVHSILVEELGVGMGLRRILVGITGSKYKPLDNIYQIKEAVGMLSEAVSKAKTPYAKAVLALVGISYIQPFEDGNKRTGRLIANAILLAYGCAPLSYRSVEEKDYRNAILAFYEINSIMPFKKIFIEQYLFAAENYAI